MKIVVVTTNHVKNSLASLFNKIILSKWTINMKLPESLKIIISERDWNSWSQEQQEFILQNQKTTIQAGSLKNQNLHAEYSDKTWELGKVRRDVGEICKCKFPYCFYAFPRNWSMGSDSDVWNLMRCANVNCGLYFESCL